MRRRLLKTLMAGTAVAALGALLVAFTMRSKLETMVEIYQDDGFEGVYHRLKDYVPGASPNVSWPSAAPEAVGLNGEALEAFREAMAAQGTSALIVARDGRMALEWYEPSHGPNQLESIAALGKGATASPILLAALSDGRIDLDDPAAKYIPEWQADPQKSKITLRHLATHSSGVENVSFAAEQSGWKDTYLRNGALRFKLAIERAPILFEPGSQADYSGVGYYVLAYVLARAVQESGEYSDVRSYLRDRIMRPIGIPTHDWIVGYREAVEVDGMTLYAIGSGGRYTPRALARIGELFARNGEWEGRQIIDSQWVARALTYGGSPPIPAQQPADPPAGLGWWVNSGGFFPSLPADAAVAAGGDHSILLVVPSLRLVAVRTGASFGPPGGEFWAPIDGHFFAPLMATVGTARAKLAAVAVP